MLPTAPAINVVSTVFSAIERDDWATVADHTAPPAIERARRHDLAHVLAWAEYVATYAQGEKQGYGSGGTINPELLARYGDLKLEWMRGTPTIAELAAVDPRKFFVRWLQFTHGPTNRHRPPRRAMVPRRIVGAVPEGDRFVHVVYRGIGWIGDERVQIMPALPVDGRWLVLPNDDVLRMATLPLPDDDRNA